MINASMRDLNVARRSEAQKVMGYDRHILAVPQFRRDTNREAVFKNQLALLLENPVTARL